VATIERFAKTRQAMIELRQNEQSDSGCARWFKIELAFVLAEATGRRLNSIRLLRWEDVDLKKSEIRWRADSDKKGREWVIPVPESLRDELRQFRVHLGAIAGWVFPSESDGEKPMDRYQFDKWLRIAEDHAELKKLEGGLWHPYRRKWATERKDLPIKDVMAAGGWLDVDTLLKSYQQADRATLLRVMNEPRKLSDGTSESVIGE
jgi:integrase